MEVTIYRGDQKAKAVFHSTQMKDMVIWLVIILLGRDKFISPSAASEKLGILSDLCSESVDSLKEDTRMKKDWSLIKRRIKSNQKILVRMKPGFSTQVFIWNFISALDGNPNLSGFGFCEKTFKDRLKGNAEKVSLYQLTKFN
jgi:hypothetical protein